MSSILSAQGVVVATAMAVSGTFILLALRLQKNIPNSLSVHHSSPLLRSCISSDGKKKEKKKKRVHFAEDVVDPIGNSEDFRKKHRANYLTSCDLVAISSLEKQEKKRDMPANRAALYQGMLKNRVLRKDRVVHQRFAYSY